MSEPQFDHRLADELKQFQFLLKDYLAEEQDRIMDAACWGSIKHLDQSRASGEPYFIHPLNVCKTLIAMKMDAATLIAALLHDIEEDTLITRDQLRARYGEEVEMLVDSVTKISVDKVANKEQQTNETIRKMFLAMSQDVRVMIIKLADKLHNMTTLSHKPREKQIKTAVECLDIYAPLASKLGIYWLKMRLEDLSFLYLQPDLSAEITQYCHYHKEPIHQLLQEVEQQIGQKTPNQLYRLTPLTRNNYAIFRRLKNQNKTLKQLNYPYGISLICQTKEQCYQLINPLLSLYKPLDGILKDFISNPKENWYQGLQTTVMSHDGNPIEIQIVSETMHKINTYGVTAKWLFKQDISLNPNDFALLKRIKTWEDLRIAADNFVHYIKNDDDRNKITLYTPQGTSQTLPHSSTALDYAFKLGRHIGLGTISIEVDGLTVPFNTPLKHNQMINVVSSLTVHPKLGWLQQVNRSSSKEAIMKWFRKNNFTLIKTDSFIYAYPSNQKQHDHLSIAPCCNPNPSNDIVLLKENENLTLHRSTCIESYKIMPSNRFEVMWLQPKQIIYKYKIESLYLRNLFALVEQAIHQAGGQLIAGTMQPNDKMSITSQWTVKVDDEHKQLIIEQQLSITSGVLSVETL